MKKLSIRLFNANDEVTESLICEHLDSTKSMTCLYHVVKLNKTSDERLLNNEPRNYHFAKDVTHWNLLDGLITIYYNDHCYMEISRIND